MYLDASCVCYMKMSEVLATYRKKKFTRFMILVAGEFKKQEADVLAEGPGFVTCDGEKGQWK